MNKPSQCQPRPAQVSRPAQRYHRPASDIKMVVLIHYMWGSFVSKQLLADSRGVLHQNYIEDQASPTTHKDSPKHYRNTLEPCQLPLVSTASLCSQQNVYCSCFFQISLRKEQKLFFLVTTAPH